MSLENIGNFASAPVGRQTLRKIRRADQADADCLNVTLFRNARREVCGWFIGPLSLQDGRFDMSFLPENEETMASLAVVRALNAADASGHCVCLIDPDDLWDTIWKG